MNPTPLLLGGTASSRNVMACKVCEGLVLLAYAIIGSVLLGQGLGLDPDYSGAICGVVTQTTTDYRTAGLPLAQYLGETPIYPNYGTLAPANTFNVLWIAVAALYFSAIWLCCLPAFFYFFAAADSGYFSTLDLDFNWYRWVHWGVTHPLWWVTVLIVAGAHNVFVITLVAFAVLAWIVFLAFNEGAAKLDRRSLTSVRQGTTGQVVSTFFEAFLCAAVLFIVVAAVYFSYASSTAANAVLDAAVPNARALIWATTVYAFVVYLLFLLCGVAAHTYAAFWQGAAKELCYECSYFIFVTGVFWIIAGFALSYCPAAP